MSIRFYFAPGACSLAVHIALEEAGVEHIPIRLSLADGDQRKPEFLSVNPSGRIPALVVDGQLITEVTGILAWLAHRYPKAGLLPLDNPFLTGKAFELASWFASSVHPSFAQIGRGERFTDDPATREVLKADGAVRFRRHLDRIESLFADGRPWLLGDRYSIIDAYALVFYRWAPRLSIDQNDFPAWTAQVRRLYARPAILRALAQEGLSPEPALLAAA